MRAEFLTPANQEFLAAADFYQAQAPGLGEDFILDIEASLKLITEFPNLGSRGPASTRRIHLHRFPYSLVYRPERDVLRVIRCRAPEETTWLLVGSNLGVRDPG